MCGIVCEYRPKRLNLELMKHIAHRGHESYGVSFFRKGFIENNYFKGRVDIDKVGALEKYINKNNIKYYIGHTRYSTSGLKNNSKIQPFNGNVMFKKGSEKYILAHNGNIENREGLKKHFGCNIDETLTDTQIVVSIINNMNHDSWYDILKQLISKIVGVYCLVIGIKECVYILRDTYGVRPMCYCRNTLTGSYCIISEKNQIEQDGYTFVRDIKPGTIEMLNEKGSRVIYSKFSIFTPCLFEYIYFSSPNSIIDSVDINVFRYKCGQEMSVGDSFNSNMLVCGVPETGITSGIGYADTMNLNYQQVIKKKDKGRTFILKNDEERKKACKYKYDVSGIVKGKSLVLIDDSLVRGNTLKHLVAQCREQGAIDIHIRIVSPPVTNPCYFGIDIPTKKELIASNNTVDNIKKYIGSNSLRYLGLKQIMNILPHKKSCSSCFTGDYNRSLLDW